MYVVPIAELLLVHLHLHLNRNMPKLRANSFQWLRCMIRIYDPHPHASLCTTLLFRLIITTEVSVVFFYHGTKHLRAFLHKTAKRKIKVKTHWKADGALLFSYFSFVEMVRMIGFFDFSRMFCTSSFSFRIEFVCFANGSDIIVLLF